MEEQKQIKATPLVSVGIIQENGHNHPYSRLLDSGLRVVLTPPIMAGFCVSLYESLISTVPFKDRVKFENEFKEVFVEAFDAREGYMMKREQPKPSGLFSKIKERFTKK